MAIAIASTTLTACSLDGNEPEKPIVIIDPVEKATLYACGISPSETRTAGDAQNMLFTEKDIEWFNASTREIKFRDSDIPIYKRLEPFHEIKFYLGDNALFVVSSFVADWDSRIFTDLVLHYDLISDPNQGHYYLHDCYREGKHQEECRAVGTFHLLPGKQGQAEKIACLPCSHSLQFQTL